MNWLHQHLLSCPIKQRYGLDCPGCGLQRSILALLRGDLLESVRLYPATIPLVFMIAFTLLHLKYDFKIGAQLIKMSFFIIAIIIVMNYIYKIYNHQLFN